ncbi:MAG: hypothetical protein Q4B89_00855 [Lachnospiraceae bacterium]|nr:hypothetical protein [Lachnospiraceae bacterium]
MAKGKAQVSDCLLKKCQLCKDLKSEKEKALDELCEMPSGTIEEYKARSEKMREYSRMFSDLYDMKEQIVKCLIEELGI